MINLTDRVVDFITQTRWVDLPVQVQGQAKRCLLDGLGAGLAGMDTEVGQLMTVLAAQFLPGNQATILVSGQRASALGACLANSFAANALDIDDGFRLVKGHPGACVWPVALTAAQMAPRPTGKAVLTSLVVGYEVGIRAGLIRHALSETYHSSGSWGALAGAAAGAKLLGLEAPAIRQALGAAEYHAPIGLMMKGIRTPSMVKDSIGWSGLVALASVLMASQGFTGIEPLFSQSPNRNWIEGLGSRYEILNLYFKPYAACRWAQPAIAGALK
ncbi:MAG: MmgE/PrpD family protein, partial [Deltaproteobacteria bacterium]|nr:MmgE/PrpD family protein [Deltaproteobacteria bacterium]